MHKVRVTVEKLVKNDSKTICGRRLGIQCSVACSFWFTNHTSILFRHGRPACGRDISASRSSNLPGVAFAALRSLKGLRLTQHCSSNWPPFECSRSSRRQKRVNQVGFYSSGLYILARNVSAARCKAGRVSNPFAPVVVPKLIIINHQSSIGVLFLLSLTVGLSGIITILDNQVLRSVVVSAREVAVQDGLGTSRISLLSIDGCSRHVRDHGVPASPWVLCSSEWVVLGCWLWEPDVTTVAVELAACKRLGNILLDNDGTTGGVNQPCTYNMLVIWNMYVRDR